MAEKGVLGNGDDDCEEAKGDVEKGGGFPVLKFGPCCWEGPGWSCANGDGENPVIIILWRNGFAPVA